MPRKPTAPEWQELTIEDLTGGINKSVRAELIEQNELLVANNVVLRQKRIVGDTGYKSFGSVIRGVAQTDYQFFFRTGVSELLLITTATVYKYNAASVQWQYISNSVDTTATVQANAGALTITVTDITGFADNDFIGITLDNGFQHQTRVNGAPAAGVITFDDAIPAGRNAPIGAAVVEAVALTGDLDFQISIVPIASNDWLTFTNGVDVPKRYDGTDIVDIPGLPAGLTTCKVLAQFNSALFMLSTTEGGLDFPQRIRRSDIGDPTNWTTNLAGYDDLYNLPDFIVGAEILGPYLIVYRERSIVRGQYVNSAGLIYDWTPVVDGEGAASTMAIVNLNSQHLFFGNAGIFSYTGGYDIEHIGDKIFHQIFSDEGDINATYKYRVFSFYVEELDEAWFFYVAGSTSEFPNVLIRYNVGDESWARREFNDDFVGFGFYQTITSRRWVDLVGTWADQSWRWDSRTVASDSPTTHLMGATLTEVMEYDYVTNNDDGVTVTSVVETKDFFHGQSIRFDTLQFHGKGQSLQVEYSTDSGGIYTVLGTVTSTDMDIHTLSSQFICDKIRFRFTCEAASFELGWIYFSFAVEAGPMYRSA